MIAEAIRVNRRASAVPYLGGMRSLASLLSVFFESLASSRWACCPALTAKTQRAQRNSRRRILSRRRRIFGL